ncbi:MAG: hypothetical protein SFV51_14795 [Bryobacteraceae bacterium]|nr:hypothetical protein [Bryobacteraceae bacterium]
MITRGLWLILLLSISAPGADKDKRFRVEPASSYPTKQSAGGLTIAAVPYVSAEQSKPAFGKVNPYDHGVLPVLVVMQNDTGKTLRLENMEMTYVTPERRNVDQTPAGDVPYLEGAQRPNFGGPPLPIPRRKKKNKLAIPEIDGLAFHAKMVPEGNAAHGFVYFQTGHRKGAILYIRGIAEASTGKELLYFEVPLD